MLRAYRRHTELCAHRDEGRACWTCRCPIWVQGFLGTEEIRKSLELRDWQKAQKKLRDWETAGVPAAKGNEEAVSIAAAEKEFLARCEAE